MIRHGHAVGPLKPTTVAAAPGTPAATLRGVWLHGSPGEIVGDYILPSIERGAPPAAPTSDPARVYVFDSKACAFDESGAFIEGQPDPFGHPCTYIYVVEQRRTWRHGFSTPFGPSRTTIGEDRGLSSVSCHGTRWR
jgi:hypothetical protein